MRRQLLLGVPLLALFLTLGACSGDPIGPGTAGLAPSAASAAKGSTKGAAKAAAKGAAPAREEEDPESGTVSTQSDYAVAWPD